MAQEKLDAVLPEGEEREWFRQRLLPLLGIEATSTAEREELFTAWRRFLERIAEERPTVLVFEDLHWADEAMLAFLEHLADLAEGVPLLLVGTARPELYERHPDYASGCATSTPINLAPLSQEETARLVSALLDATVLPAELQQPILDRAGGNPLYAEEFVRLLKDRDLLVRKGSSWELREGAEVPFPESVQALIAARLDTLEPDAKSLLADAAVIGKVFWAGAVGAMGDRDPQTVTSDAAGAVAEGAGPPGAAVVDGRGGRVRLLARPRPRCRLQPAPPRLPRHPPRRRRQRGSSRRPPSGSKTWPTCSPTTTRPPWSSPSAAGQTEQAAELEAPALRFLGLAGERALGLDTAAALASFERALDAHPGRAPERAAALARFGEAALHAGRFGRGERRSGGGDRSLRGARRSFAAQRGRWARFSMVLFQLGDPRGWTLPAEALALLEPLPPSPELVKLLTS